MVYEHPVFVTKEEEKRDGEHFRSDATKKKADGPNRRCGGHAAKYEGPDKKRMKRERERERTGRMTRRINASRKEDGIA